MEKTKEKNQIMQRIIKSVKGKGIRIVFPESNDKRIVEAAKKIVKDGIAKPILIGNRRINNLEFFELKSNDSNFISFLKERFKEDDVKILRKDPVYYGAYLVSTGKADGLISGANHTTAHTIRAALKMIQMKKDVKRISSFFLISKGMKSYLFADCAVNILPDEEELAEIAYLTSKSAEMIGIKEKRVAFLSFSTKGSAEHPSLERIRNATKIAMKKIKDGFVDGELQFDAAIVPEVGKKKAPQSKVAGNANILIFPDLQSGNIGYKIAERLGGFEAIGPIIQGLRLPVNDLSRGCNSKDIYNLAAITALQAIMAMKDERR